MTHHRGWRLSESHLLPDAVVAFVDQELSLGAHERAAAHLAHCPSCAADVAAQRAASAAVRGAEVPSISAGFLASLRAIPQHTDLPGGPDHLAVGADGQVVAVQRPECVAGLREVTNDGGASSDALGSSAPLGTSPNVLGQGESPRLGVAGRRAAQGAGVVVSGLVLGALALVATSGGDGTGGGTTAGPARGGQQPRATHVGVLRAQFGVHRAPAPTTTRVAAADGTTAAGRDHTAAATTGSTATPAAGSALPRSAVSSSGTAGNPAEVPLRGPR
jgi:hypothetical protein